MKLDSFTAIVAALEDAGVRYLVAGGMAVNAHGYLRFTKDLDIVVELVPENIERAFAALGGVGYHPSVPVTSSQFADQRIRESWIAEKGMTVLNFWSDEHRETPVDVFVAMPFDFETEFRSALAKGLGSLTVRFISIPTLISMKRVAGRPQDLIDIDYLRLRFEDRP
jgi:hypothetical protein